MDGVSVLFYESPSGQRPIEKFLRDIDRGARAKCLAFIERLARGDNRLFKLKHAEKIQGRADLGELKPSHSGVEYRFLYARLNSEQYVILHALKKKSWRLSQEEFDTAERGLREIRGRQSQ